MNLVIFGATGGIGRQVLEQAIIAGHDVTAVVRDPKKLSGQKVRVVTADLAMVNPTVLAAAIAGADAVISGLGPRDTSCLTEIFKQLNDLETFTFSLSPASSLEPTCKEPYAIGRRCLSSSVRRCFSIQ